MSRSPKPNTSSRETKSPLAGDSRDPSGDEQSLVSSSPSCMDMQLGGTAPKTNGTKSAESAVVQAEEYKIIIGSEPLIPIRNKLPQFVHKLVGGARIHNSTAYRWALKGVRGRRLPTVRVGGRLFTTASAFSWWSQELAQDLIGVVDAAVVEDEEETGNADVLEILRRAGIKT